MGNVRTGLSLTKAFMCKVKAICRFAAFTMNNLLGDYYIPGNVFGGKAVKDELWRQIKACLPAACPLKNQSSCFHRIVMTVDFA